MRKIFACLFGMLFVVGAANAANEIKAATTNTVKKSVYDINYGTTDSSATAYGYRTGRIPQEHKLTAVQGTAPSGTVTVGNLASVSTSGGVESTNAAPDAQHAPTATIAANTANITVLQRDKLVTPQNGNCAAGFQCGYVTTGSHSNDVGTSDKIWLKVTKCTTSNGVTSCTW